jgi:hypothetical protein
MASIIIGVIKGEIGDTSPRLRSGDMSFSVPMIWGKNIVQQHSTRVFETIYELHEVLKLTIKPTMALISHCSTLA